MSYRERGIVLLVVIVVAMAAVFFPRREVRTQPGMLVAEEPDQRLIANGTPWDDGDFHILPLANYHISARLLSVRHYWLGKQAQLSPVDFAVGWGIMSDQAVLDSFSFSQGSRYLSIRQKGRDLPAPKEEVLSHFANMHLIPANPQVAADLKKAAEGKIVTLDGYLIEATASGGWRWRSSLSRTDTGPGACELMWVDACSYR